MLLISLKMLLFPLTFLFDKDVDREKPLCISWSLLLYSVYVGTHMCFDGQLQYFYEQFIATYGIDFIVLLWSSIFIHRLSKSVASNKNYNLGPHYKNSPVRGWWGTCSPGGREGCFPAALCWCPALSLPGHGVCIYISGNGTGYICTMYIYNISDLHESIHELVKRSDSEVIRVLEQNFIRPRLKPCRYLAGLLGTKFLP